MGVNTTAVQVSQVTTEQTGGSFTFIGTDNIHVLGRRTRWKFPADEFHCNFLGRRIKWPRTEAVRRIQRCIVRVK